VSVLLTNVSQCLGEIQSKTMTVYYPYNVVALLVAPQTGKEEVTFGRTEREGGMINFRSSLTVQRPFQSAWQQQQHAELVEGNKRKRKEGRAIPELIRKHRFEQCGHARAEAAAVAPAAAEQATAVGNADLETAGEPFSSWASLCRRRRRWSDCVAAAAVPL
jgi:hypothetical protein